MSGSLANSLLLQKAVAGDATALEALLLVHFDRLVASIAARLPADLRAAVSAEDVVQDAMIVAFQRISGFTSADDAAFYAWLERIAENRLMDVCKALRAAKRGGGWDRISDALGATSDEILPLLELLPNPSRSPSRSAAAHEAACALTAAIETLEPDYRDAVRLRFIEMQPIEVCCARLNRSEGAVYMLLNRALAALRGRMGDTTRFFSS
ncbi:MAG: sigma-70 family RNA polymerase sigma factor [Phycisphaerales bacterium]|nr:sigma-70 family RNA polymerase sigma factor [Phycisphaerales bacterium]